MHLARSPLPWTDLHQIWYWSRSRLCNHLWQIFSRSVMGGWICGGWEWQFSAHRSAHMLWH